MRKILIDQNGGRAVDDAPWLDLEALAQAEITSEGDRFPIEHALGAAATTGWRAGTPGPQMVRLRFDTPVEVHRVLLRVVDRTAERRQEMSLYATLNGVGRQEVWRGQFVFSPHGSTEEVEDLVVELPGLLLLELHIDPDGADGGHSSQHYAVLERLRLL